MYREMRGADGMGRMIDPQDEQIAKAIESGQFKLTDPSVRARLDLLTPAERIAEARTASAGGSESRLAMAEQRRQLDADPEVQSTKAMLNAAIREKAALQGNKYARPDRIAKAEQAVADAQRANMQAMLRASKRLGLPGVVQPDQPSGNLPPIDQQINDFLNNGAPQGGGVPAGPDQSHLMNDPDYLAGQQLLNALRSR
jgi:hypothetical protein